MAKKQIKHTATQLDKILNAAFPAEGSPSMTDSEKAQLQQTIGVTDLAAKINNIGLAYVDTTTHTIVYDNRSIVFGN